MKRGRVPTRHSAALVFGGSEGIGLSVAEGLLRQGCHVALVARDAVKLAAARQRLLDLTGAQPAHCLIDCADVTEAASVVAACGRLLAAMPDVSLVFNSAGHTLPGYVDTLTAADYEAQWRHNCLGMVQIVNAVLPHLRARGGGQIVGTSSLLGLMGMFGYSGYAASKFALNGYLLALRAELAPEGIGVTVLCPPAVDTPGFARENLIKPAEVLRAEQQAGVAHPAVVAGALLRRLPRNPALVVPTLQARLVYLAYRLVPGLVQAQLARPSR